MAKKNAKKKPAKKGKKKSNGALKPKLKINKVTEKGAQLMVSNVRCAFVNIAKPSKPPQSKDDPTYEMTMLIPKSERQFIEKFRAVIADVIKQSEQFETAEHRKKAMISHKIGGDGAIIKDGDATENKDGEVYDGLEDHYIIKAKTGSKQVKNGEFEPKVKFAIVDRMAEVIPTEEIASQIYAGAWYSLSVNLVGFTYAKKKRGVTCYLSGVQKLKNDERLGSASNPFETRDDIEDNDIDQFDDEEDY